MVTWCTCMVTCALVLRKASTDARAAGHQCLLAAYTSPASTLAVSSVCSPRPTRCISRSAASPLLQLFGEALSGAPLIRAAGAVAQHEARHGRALRRALRAKFNLFAAQLWLDLHVEMLGCAFSATVVLYAIVDRKLSHAASGGGGSGDGGGEGGSGDDGGGDAGGGGASSTVGSSSPGFVGLALSYALSISWLLQGTLRTVMQAESP